MDGFTREHYIRCFGRSGIVEGGISFDRVYEEIIYPEFEIGLDESRDLGRDESGERILGFYDPIENCAYVTASLSVPGFDAQLVFTRWHEVFGHGVMQGAWLRDEHERGARVTPPMSTTPSHQRAIARLEEMANVAAAEAAAPTWLVRLAMRKVMDVTGQRPMHFSQPAKYFLQTSGGCIERHADDYEHLCNHVARIIQPMFGGLSVQSLGYRVQACGLVEDRTPAPRPLFFRKTASQRERPRPLAAAFCV